MIKFGQLINAVTVINNHVDDKILTMKAAIRIKKFLDSIQTETKLWDEKLRDIQIKYYTKEVKTEDGSLQKRIPDEKLEEFINEVNTLAAEEIDFEPTLTLEDIEAFQNCSIKESYDLSAIIKSDAE